MKNLKLLTIIFISASTLGCKPTIENGKRAEKRIEVFESCMDLAAKLNKATEQHYNDLSEVVVQCSNQAYYMTKRLNFNNQETN